MFLSFLHSLDRKVIPGHFCRCRLETATDIDCWKYKFLFEKLNNLLGAARRGGRVFYPQNETFCTCFPWAFPKIFVEIGWQLLFFSFNGILAEFAQKSNFSFLSQKERKTEGMHPRWFFYALLGKIILRLKNEVYKK